MLLVSAQVSPGKLSEAHAHLEGMSNCTKCHALGKRVTNQKCLDCHKEIAARIGEQRGYHSSTEVNGEDCTKCHSDHHGREFKMIRFDAAGFDHVLAGFDLHGSHKDLRCSECHKSGFIMDPRLKRKSSTYLGLNQECVTCHRDYHQGTLSPDCLSCHDFRVFRPASRFKHQDTRFRLRGKHADVECVECHEVFHRNGFEMQEFAGIPFENCTSCHEDVHDNKFGQNCSRCHSEESFKRIRQLESFNHSMTDYPLEGKHLFLACNSCHKNNYTDPIDHNKCMDCHSDYHHDEFTGQGKSPDCSDCHSTAGFNRSNFTIERHNRTAFELKGAHLATPCYACHKKTKRWSFREIGKQCVDCHDDIHEPFLDKKYYVEASCENCHNSERWNDIEFDHLTTGFPLLGAHLKQSCRSCHFRSDALGNSYQEFARLLKDCLSCHQDVHAGQFADRGGTGCLECHDYSDWSGGKFDHDNTDFKLIGKHSEVACYKCHLPAVSNGNTYIQYKIKDHSCESCH